MLEKEPGMTVVIGQCRPDSRGSIHIKSATPGDRARDPAELPVGPDRPRRHGGGHADRPQDRAHPSIAKYIAFENNPGDKVQSYDEWLDFARAHRPDDLSTSSAPARWAAIRWPWSTTACACTASPACA